MVFDQTDIKLMIFDVHKIYETEMAKEQQSKRHVKLEVQLPMKKIFLQYNLPAAIFSNLSLIKSAHKWKKITTIRLNPSL